MDITCSASFQGRDAINIKTGLLKHFQAEGLNVAVSEWDASRALDPKVSFALYFVSEISPQLHSILHAARDAGWREIIVVLGPLMANRADAAWDLLKSGASDVLFWTDPGRLSRQLQSRLERHLSIQKLIEAAQTDDLVVGRSTVWRSAISQLVAIAHFSDTATLILGESGTGKEVAAKLIHRMDRRSRKHDLVVQDCSTLVQDLAGSELFGHERGAFTGAASDRQGAFALAHEGTLFLDEIGELPLPVQAQLLRAIQEGTYKRVGGTAWHRTNFRLICATNRNLEDMVRRGLFRADLYHRIAGHVCWLPPLRERPEDIIPLAHSFVRQSRPSPLVPTFDPLVCDYLLQRDYPGNVRELKQVIGRLMSRCGSDGTISVGCVSEDERPSGRTDPIAWSRPGFEAAVGRAVVMGVRLKDIGRAAEDCAIRYAIAAEDGSLKRAALRLGVTDRALQLRRVQVRGADRCRVQEAGLAQH